MNANHVDRVVEAIFGGEAEGGMMDQPHPRFKWTPPTTQADLDPEALWRRIENEYKDAYLMKPDLQELPPMRQLNAWEAARPRIKQEFLNSPKAIEAARKRLGMQPNAAAPARPAAPAAPAAGNKTFDELFPAGSVASTDDFLDHYNRRILPAKGKARTALRKEFNGSRSEFEAKIREWVNSLLG